MQIKRKNEKVYGGVFDVSLQPKEKECKYSKPVTQDPLT